MVWELASEEEFEDQKRRRWNIRLFTGEVKLKESPVGAALHGLRASVGTEADHAFTIDAWVPKEGIEAASRPLLAEAKRRIDEDDFQSYGEYVL